MRIRMPYHIAENIGSYFIWRKCTISCIRVKTNILNESK